MQVVSISSIKPNPSNPRLIKDDKFHKLVQSLKDFPEMASVRPIVVNQDMIILGGNMRYKAIKEAKWKEVPVEVVDWDEAKQREFIIKDNVGFGEWDWDDLANNWNAEELDAWGLDVPVGFTEELEAEEDDKKVEAITKLQDKFIVPPFSVLNAREGYWQDRKSYWNILISDNGESRDNIESKVNAIVKNWENKPYKGGVIRENSISILDSVLAEIINKWFGLPGGKTFDCFAGDTVFGYVSSYVGNTFTGIELRKSQSDLNNQRVKGMNANYICDDGRNVLNHLEINSQDLLFSCPPYFDLEIYSDLPNDASNQKEYKDFIHILDVAFSNSIKCLKDNRFAVIVCGDIRNEKGNYYRFPDDIKDIFYKNGLILYNELILVQSVGNGALRANRYMNSRKVVKMHEQVLVFFKGNPKEIKLIFPKIDIDEGSDA